MKLFPLNRAWYRVLARSLLGVLLGCTLFFAGTSVAEASLSGLVGWNYSNLSATADNETVADFEQFSQRYSVYWDKQGTLMGGRGGQFNIGLGYEWLSTQRELNGEDGNVTADKILYNGELTFAPGALPLRLHAYAYDNQAPAYTKASLASSLLETDLNMGFSSGERRRSGLTFMVGIKNGSYLGKFRNILSKYPRLFVDYKDIYVHDEIGYNKQHYQNRDLAFVSLNKKDNWFHYRFREMTDYRNPGNNFSSKAFVLGTVDHHLKRQWIYLTNWIKISTDASYTEEHDESLADAVQNIGSYNINFFSQMSYRKIKVSNYSTFYRSNDTQSLNETYQIPVYASGQVSPEMSWRSMLINYSGNTTSLSPSPIGGFFDEESYSDFDKGSYGAAQLTMRQQARSSLSVKLDVEDRRTSSSDGSALRLRLETYKNNKYQSQDDYGLSYSVTYQNGSNNQDDVNYTEQQLDGRYAQQLAPRHRLILTQQLLYGFGETGASLMNYITVEGTNSLNPSQDSLKETTGTSNNFRSLSTVRLESILSARLRNAFSGTLEWEDGSETEQFWRASLQQFLSYDRGGVSFSTTNKLLLGDDLSANFSSSSSIVESTIVANEEANFALVSDSILKYRPNKQFDSSLKLVFSLLNSDNDDQFGTELNLDNRYVFYSKGGARRWIGSLYNEIDYAFFKSNSGQRTYLSVLLGGRYLPYRRLQLGSELGYHDNDTGRTYRVRASAALSFAKLQCEASYTYALGKYNDNENFFVGERKEQMVEIEVKKQF